jgi:hypothetical protein
MDKIKPCPICHARATTCYGKDGKTRCSRLYCPLSEGWVDVEEWNERKVASPLTVADALTVPEVRELVEFARHCGVLDLVAPFLAAVASPCGDHVDCPECINAEDCEEKP